MTCATDVTIDDSETRTALPLNQTVRIPLGKVSGERKFACGMDMYKGRWSRSRLPHHRDPLDDLVSPVRVS